MAAYSSHHWFPASNSSGSTSPAHLLVVASSLRLGKHCRDLYSANLHVVFHPPASSSDGYSLDQKRDFACRKRYSSKSFSFLEKLSDSFSASCSSCFSFFTGKEFGRGYVNEGRMQIRNSGGKPVNGRMLTNVLLVVNVLTYEKNVVYFTVVYCYVRAASVRVSNLHFRVYAAQIATQGKLLLWGAKVNSLIDKGQLWRLATSALLHANIGHLMINCYSLNSVGPTVEKMSGSRRFLAIYFSSAIASKPFLARKLGSVMSYRFSQSPSVGASGAIFGLVIAMDTLGSHDIAGIKKFNYRLAAIAININEWISYSMNNHCLSQTEHLLLSANSFHREYEQVGSYAVFVLRHRKLVGGAKEDLLHVAHVIALNMVIGFLSRGIDNWGHLGGLLGGAAVSWFLGPAWHMSRMADGKVVLADRAPIYQFINRRRLS
ncbi:hypothetical protein ZIOFF_039531 [Zingiber officinale]|uniref:Peptidase S54 rhomboid domain-containing protein n=1 Tax=Zingiber officinale TaxID=94328 RepID=A0A8J5G773_ZINOF|nr:hypothetical protein ZIOFF_039531 [Zingiber officinale]